MSAWSFHTSSLIIVRFRWENLSTWAPCLKWKRTVIAKPLVFSVQSKGREIVRRLMISSYVPRCMTRACNAPLQVPALFLKTSESLAPMSEKSDVLISEDNVVKNTGPTFWKVDSASRGYRGYPGFSWVDDARFRVLSRIYEVLTSRFKINDDNMKDLAYLSDKYVIDSLHTDLRVDIFFQHYWIFRTTSKLGFHETTNLISKLGYSLRSIPFSN